MRQYHVEINIAIEGGEKYAQLVEEAVRASLAHAKVQEPADLSVLLCDEPRIRQLNRDFLGYDQATDVLSFPVGEPTPGADSYLGDIAISIPAAHAQAKLAGHSTQAEIQLLVVHAVLHLLGYDHKDDEEKAIMWSLQNAILMQLVA